MLIELAAQFVVLNYVIVMNVQYTTCEISRMRLSRDLESWIFRSLSFTWSWNTKHIAVTSTQAHSHTDTDRHHVRTTGIKSSTVRTVVYTFNIDSFTVIVWSTTTREYRYRVQSRVRSDTAAKVSLCTYRFWRDQNHFPPVILWYPPPPSPRPFRHHSPATSTPPSPPLYPQTFV